MTMAQMTKWQKAVLESQLKSEQEAVDAIKKSYQQALKDIKAKIKELSADELTQSKIYQIEYQNALKGQVETIIDNMQSQQYGTISEYLKGCYEDGYIGAMYGIQGQGIPIMTPIDQDHVAKAVVTDSKLSKDLYSSMGKYLKPLKKAVTQEISRGMAAGEHWNDIAARIEARTSIGWSNAIRIARTEGHRIQNAAKLDAMEKAKESGADVVKQWDSTMDGKTRKSHRKLDGQIREMNEFFEVNGHKAKSPGHFGRPEEDINCRCAILERARWALDEDELAALEQKAEFWGLDKSQDFDDFKDKYIEAGKGEAKIKELSQKVADLQKAMDDYDDESAVFIGGKVKVLKPSNYEKKLNDIEPKYDDFYKKSYDLKKSDPEKAAFYEKKLNQIDEMDDKYQEWLKKKKELNKAKKEASDFMLKQEAKEQAKKAASAKQEKIKKAMESAESRKSTSDEIKLDGFRRFNDRNDADRYHRKHTVEQWARMTKDEKKALYGYTGSDYRPMNSALRKGSYGKGSSADRLIDLATSAIDKCELHDDVTARRGISWSAAANMLGIPADSATKEVLDALVGATVGDKGFMSCGAAAGTGFEGVTLSLYLPKGTKAVYAEPFSKYGMTSPSKLWDGKKEADGIGKECELLLQRGSQFRVLGFETDDNGHVKSISLVLTGQSN